MTGYTEEHGAQSILRRPCRVTKLSEGIGSLACTSSPERRRVLWFDVPMVLLLHLSALESGCCDSREGFPSSGKEMLGRGRKERGGGERSEVEL